MSLTHVLCVPNQMILMVSATLPIYYKLQTRPRDFLGHVSITTTEIYLKTETELKRSVLEQSYPDVVTQDIPEWKDDTELLQWLNNFCRQL